jgi:tetratricopeptide (TPR) repeat protein
VRAEGVLTRHRALAVGAVIAAVAWDPIAPAADVKRVFGIGVAVAALGLGLARLVREAGAPKVTLPAAGALWLAFVAWSGASLAWGSPSGISALGTLAGGSGLLLASRALGFSAWEGRRAAGLTAAGVGGISALFAIAQALGGARGLGIHGGHGNPNWLGLLLAFTLPLSIDLAASLRRESTRAWGFAAAIASVQVPALILARSRVAWAASLAGLAVWLILSGALRRNRAIVAGAIAIAIGTGSAAARSAPPNATSAEDLAAGAEDTPIAEAWEGRVWIWRASADAALARLPIGAGLGDFAGAYLDAQGKRLANFPPKIASRRFLNATTAHSDWIEVAVSSGLPAPLLLAAAVIAALGIAIRERRSAEAAALVAFAVCAAGDSPLAQPGFVIPFALLLGASSSDSRPNPSSNPTRIQTPIQKARRPIRLPYPRAITAIALGCAALLLAAAAATWLGSRKLTRAREGLLPEERLAALASAAKLDPRSGEAALALALAHLEIGDPVRALRELERSRALLANIGTDIAIGNAHLLAGGSRQLAAAAYRRALARHPGSFRARVNLAEALIATGARGEAEEHLAAARSIYPGHPKLALVAERLRKAIIDAETGEPR